MRLIELTQGKFAQVDDADFEYVNQFSWHILKKKNTIYAIYTKIVNGKAYGILMHRLIMNTPKGLQVDHIDHNGLNNQRSNLRNCTNGQNQMNRIAFGKSIYLGVIINAKNKPVARININGKRINLGTFKTEAAAALAYNEAAIKYHGEFANLNIIE